MNISHRVFIAIAVSAAICLTPVQGYAFANRQDAAEIAYGNRDQARILEVKGIRNLRDIGGYENRDGRRVKWGRIYRSGDLSTVSSADQSLLNSLALNKIIDFRSNEERTRAPSKWLDAATLPQTTLLSIGGNAADWSSKLSQQLQSGVFTEEEIHKTFVDTYRAIPQQNKAEYAAMFDTILEGKGAVLIHCTAGKDRTGIAAALILSALDVPRDTIMQDFMLTNDAVDLDRILPLLAKIFSRQSGNELDPNAIRPIAAVDAIFLETTFQTIEDDYGSVDNYLIEALGLSADKQERLKELLLDE